MSKLFIELYLDKDVNVVVTDLLRARGFITITTRAVGQLGKSDTDQLAYAVSQKMTLLTHNRVDFERLQNNILLWEKPITVCLPTPVV